MTQRRKELIRKLLELPCMQVSEPEKLATCTITGRITFSMELLEAAMNPVEVLRAMHDAMEEEMLELFRQKHELLDEIEEEYGVEH